MFNFERFGKSSLEIACSPSSVVGRAVVRFVWAMGQLSIRSRLRSQEMGQQ